MVGEGITQVQEQQAIRPRIVLFDVDGVITSPNLKKPHPDLLVYVATNLFYKNPLALISTRDFGWVDANVLAPIRPWLPSQKLDQLFASCEKGAINVSFKSGEPRKDIDQSLIVPDGIQVGVRERVEGSPYYFFMPGKEAVITVEIYGGDDTTEKAKIDAQNAALDELYNKWVIPEILKHSGLKADRTKIAVDIYPERGNKRISAVKFIEHLQRRGIDVASYAFLAIGDSLPDIEMADGVRELGLEVEFGWVGNGEMTDPRGHRIITPDTGELNDVGTVALLRQLGEFDRFNPIGRS